MGELWNPLAGKDSVFDWVKRAKRANGQEEQKKRKEFQKLKKIIAKFKMGKKLRGSELSFLAKADPELYVKVVKIVKQRKAMEIRLKNAKSKEEAADIVSGAMRNALNNQAMEEFEKISLANQLREAYKEFMESDSYKSLPNDDLEAKKEELSLLFIGEREKEEVLEEGISYDSSGGEREGKVRSLWNIDVAL